MRHLTLSLLSTLALATPAFAQPSAWTIDPTHSTAQFSVRHMVAANVRGEFDGPRGTVSFDPKDVPGTLRVEAAIDARTIDTRNVDRDKDLKSAGFFDVAKYPTITFTSTKSQAAGAGRLTLTGNLTMHGVTKEVTLNVEGPTPQVKDPFGNERIGATATTTIDRRDFGLRYNQLLESGGAIVGHEVKITLEIEATRPLTKE